LYAGLVALSQRSFSQVIIWNDPIPLTTASCIPSIDSSSGTSTVSDPTMFVLGALLPTSPNYTSAASLAAAAAFTGGAGSGSVDGGDAGGYFPASPPSTVAAPSSNGGDVGAGSSGLPVAPASVPNGGVRTISDIEKDKSNIVLRHLLQKNASLNRVARSVSSVATILEV
jgi:hypothetical protein